MADKPKKKTAPKRKEQVLLKALACGATVENAAQQAGLGERTVYRRLKDSEFRAKLRQFKADLVNRTAGMLTSAGLVAVKAMVDLVQDPNVAPGVRGRIAKNVLEMGTKYRECTELEERITDLEQTNGQQEEQEAP